MRATICHLTSSKSAWKSTPKCSRMCWWVWWSPGAIRWPVADPGWGSRTRRQPTSPKRPRLDFRRSATTLYPSLTAPSYPDLNPLDYFVWSYVENITNMTSYRRLWKSLLPIPDPYRGGDWGWRRLQLYYIIKLPELIFSIKVLKWRCSVVFFRTTILSFHPVYIIFLSWYKERKINTCRSKMNNLNDLFGDFFIYIYIYIYISLLVLNRNISTPVSRDCRIPQLPDTKQSDGEAQVQELWGILITP